MTEEIWLTTKKICNTQQKFETKWLNKLVIYDGNYFKIANEKYLVTAALFDYEDDITIFAIKSLEDPSNWITIKVNKQEINYLDDFRVIDE